MKTMINKINLHAHTRYSDGRDTIFEMAEQYRRLGFGCAVITDHWYGDMCKWSSISMDKEKFEAACMEADELSKSMNYPIIVGVEYGFFRMEEVLCFGRDFIRRLYEGVTDMAEFIEVRKQYPSAAIIAHPQARTSIDAGIHHCVDGYEKYNSGANLFKHEYGRFPEEFNELTAFSNADAHNKDSLDRGYNYFEAPITNEADLIHYINNKRPVKMYTIYGEEVEDAKNGY